MLQYRRKATAPGAQLAEARCLAALCARHAALFVVNDDPALAHACGASAVHLGRDDADIATARNLLGADAVIGCSCYDSFTAAVDAVAAGANYVAFGSFFPSRTKPGAARATVELLRRAARELPVPIVAIGGITRDNAAILVRAGATLLAVSADLFAAPDPAAQARSYQSLFAHPTPGEPK